MTTTTEERKEPTGRRRRDRQATERALVRAVGRVLARDGFARLGVNAVAREAGVNNVLIYRYFGGLPGLVRAFGQSAEFWPSAEEIMGLEPGEVRGLPPEERAARAVVNYFRALMARPLTREILAWELVEADECAEELARIREDVSHQLLKYIAPNRNPSGVNFRGVDAHALTAVLSAACNYLAVRSRTVDTFCGVGLNTDPGVRRLEEIMKALARGVLSQDSPVSGNPTQTNGE